MDDYTAGCRAIWAAVIVQAATDIRKGMKMMKNKKRSNEMRHWVGNAQWWVDSCSYEPTGFGWACEHLNIDPAKTRYAIYNTKEEKV